VPDAGCPRPPERTNPERHRRGAQQDAQIQLPAVALLVEVELDNGLQLLGQP
jgi:hypothetical protein